jgi:hypothetical protein
VLLALVVGDLALPDRIKGIGIGLAAGIKLTPLIFIPYLLFTRRVRAAAVSALTFAVTVGLGYVLLPQPPRSTGAEGSPGQADTSTWTTSLLTAAYCALPTPGPTRTRTGWSRR